MAQDRAISGHTSLAGANLAAGDLFEVVDVSDPTDAATGTNKKMTAAEKAAGLWPLAGDTGNVLTVDAVNGSDSTGARGKISKPFLTPAAALAAALAGDTILVWPGAYTCAASLAKNGVDWLFSPGAAVTRADDGPGGIWDDGGAAMTFVVAGAGDFTRSIPDTGGDGAVVWCSHANSRISVTANVLTYSNDATFTLSGGTAAVYQNGGRLVVRFDRLNAGGAGDNVCGVSWEDGDLTVEGNELTNASGYSVWSEAATTGDGVVNVGRIAGAVYVAGGSPALALWVTANIVRGATGLSMQTNTGNKCYVTAQKIFGSIYFNSGLLYVAADKLSATAAGTPDHPSLFYGASSAGDGRVEVRHWDVAGFAGESVVIDGGTVRLRGGDLICGAAKGVVHNGGVARLQGLEINTDGGISQNPVTVGGAGLILDRCTLVANAGRDSITAGSAQTVKNYGSVANKAANVNVTVQVQALTVDANVS